MYVYIYIYIYIYQYIIFHPIGFYNYYLGRWIMLQHGLPEMKDAGLPTTKVSAITSFQAFWILCDICNCTFFNKGK